VFSIFRLFHSSSAACEPYCTSILPSNTPLSLPIQCILPSGQSDHEYWIRSDWIALTTVQHSDLCIRQTFEQREIDSTCIPIACGQPDRSLNPSPISSALLLGSLEIQPTDLRLHGVIPQETSLDWFGSSRKCHLRSHYGSAEPESLKYRPEQAVASRADSADI
jgi:hypothetical protein